MQHLCSVDSSEDDIQHSLDTVPFGRAYKTVLLSLLYCLLEKQKILVLTKVKHDTLFFDVLIVILKDRMRYEFFSEPVALFLIHHCNCNSWTQFLRNEKLRKLIYSFVHYFHSLEILYFRNHSI